jgi:hypothetical protein
LYTIYESVSLVGHKNNALNRYILYTKDLNRGYGDVRYHKEKMTNYSIDTNDRLNINFFAALVSVALVYVSTLLIEHIEEFIGMHFSLSAISVLSLYGLLLLGYNKIWNYKLLKCTNSIPDLNGEWEGYVRKANEVHEEMINVKIKQTFRKIEIIVESNQTISKTTFASIFTDEESVPIIRYGYLRELTNFDLQEELELYSQGFAQLRFQKKKLLKGWYISGKSKGAIEITKKG